MYDKDTEIAKKYTREVAKRTQDKTQTGRQDADRQTIKTHSERRADICRQQTDSRKTYRYRLIAREYAYMHMRTPQLGTGHVHNDELLNTTGRSPPPGSYAYAALLAPHLLRVRTAYMQYAYAL